MLKVHDALDNFLLAKTGEVVESTIIWYRSHLTHMADYLVGRHIDEADDVSIYDLRLWRAHVLKRTTRYAEHPYRPEVNTRGLSITTIHDKVNVCRIFFKWLYEERLIPENPAERLKVPSRPRHKEPKAISDRDIRKLMRTAQQQGNLRDIVLLHVLAETGARVGGIAGLRIRDVDTRTGTLLVTEKGSKTRAVYLATEKGIQAMREYLRARRDVDHDYVWVNVRGGKLTKSGIYQMLRRLAKKAGVKRFNPHAFRHALARELLQNGVSLESVSKILGHEDVKTTAEFYAIWTKTELQTKHRQATVRRNLWQDL